MKHSIDIEKASLMYCEGHTLRQLEAEFGVPCKTIGRYLKGAGVTLRNPGAPMNQTLCNGDWLRKKYEVEGLSTTQIAEMSGTTARVVSSWLSKHGIAARGVGSEKGHSRNSAEAKDRMSLAKRGKYVGERNPNWRGGVQSNDPDRSRYPAKAWSKAVRSRDKVCVECGSGERLHAHHLKRWKDYPELRYDVSNGVTLCHSCHERAHGRGFKFRWPQ